MEAPIKRFEVIGKFSCLGADCPDTCCRGWDMPSDARQRAFYGEKAPELLDAIDPAESVMKRCEKTGNCTQLKDGLCTIHARYGDAFLSDACYFYPRFVHAVGNSHIVSGAISCPEMLRLILTTRTPFALEEYVPERTPQPRRNLVPEGMTAQQLEASVLEAIAIAGDETTTPEQALQIVFTRTLEQAGIVDESPPEPKRSDAHAIYYALALTEAFGRSSTSTNLAGVVAVMAQQLDCNFDRETRQISLGPRASFTAAELSARWHVDAARALAPTLRRWLQAQLAMTIFPYGGIHGATMLEKAAVLIQRFATIRLALMCHVCKNAVPPDEATVLHVIQAIARFQDHLADIELTRMIHRDSGWTSTARLRGLITGA